MVLLRLVFMWPVMLAAPELMVNWTSAQFKAVRIRVTATDELLSKCLKSGLAMEYSYQMRICRRRMLWFDACAPKRREKRVLNYDPISNSYAIVADRFGDEAGPESRKFGSFEEAKAALAGIDAVPLDYLTGGEAGFAGSGRAYVKVRVHSDCRGDYNRTLARISSFLTMGLLRISGFDSQWVGFRLGQDGDQ